MGVLTTAISTCLCLGQPQGATCQLAPKFEAGSRLVYEVRTVTEVFPIGAPDRAAAPASSTYTTAATLRLTIDSVDERGTATVLGAFVKLRNELATGGKNYRLEMKEGEPPPPPPAADGGPGSKADEAAGEDVLTVGQREAPGAGEPRVTLTLKVLLASRALYLHIEGGEKVETLRKAEAEGPVEDMPVRAILRQTQTPLTIYWCP